MSLETTPGLSLQGKVITLQAPLGTETGSFTASLEISLQDYPSISSVKYEFSYTINPYIPSEEQIIPSVSFPPYFEPALPDLSACRRQRNRSRVFVAVPQQQNAASAAWQMHQDVSFLAPATPAPSLYDMRFASGQDCPSDTTHLCHAIRPITS